MKKIPVIIDCNTGIDDMISFAVTLTSDKLNILGITTVAGNQTVDITTQNTLNGVAIMGRTDIPVAKGAEKPLSRPLQDAGYIHGETGLGTYQFAEKTVKQPETEDAVELMRRLLAASEEKVVILAIAPLTNVARLLMDHPEAGEKIDKIVFMGGSLRTGNPTPVSTFNVLADPEAARYVMKSGVPFHMCPLDTTREVYLTADDIEAIGAIGNPVARMNYEMCRFYNDAVNKNNNADKRFKGLCIHDLCAAVYVTDPQLFTTVKYQGDVETEGELTLGFTVLDYENIRQVPEEERNVTFISSVDRDGVLKIYFDALKCFGEQGEEIHG